MSNIEQDLIEGAAAAAGVLGLTKRQVYHMVAKKRLPCTRIGNRLYFRRSELERAFSAEQIDINFAELNSSLRLLKLIGGGVEQLQKL